MKHKHLLQAPLLLLCGVFLIIWFSSPQLVEGGLENVGQLGAEGTGGAQVAHLEAVSKVSQEIRSAEKNQAITILRKKAHSHCPRSVQYKQGTKQVDISALDRIISIDRLPATGGGGPPFVATVRAGALATMEDLVRALAPHGLMPAVVPEFRKMTIGGAIQGLAAESSSFKYGFLHDVCAEFELVLADGRIVAAAPDNEYADLFAAVPGSYGSLALLASATIYCVPATAEVEVEARSHATPEAFLVECAQPRTSGADFLEGLGLKEGRHISVAARFCKEGPSQGVRKIKLHSVFSPWFFKHIKNSIRAMDRKGCYKVRMPLEDYLFRHDRGAFWMASYRIPHPIGRLIGAGLDSRRMYQAADLMPWAFPKHQILLQDFMLPKPSMPSFVTALQERLGLWPLWYLPMKNTQHQGHIMSVPGWAGDFCNVGAYGIPQKKFNFKQDNIAMEEVLSSLGGRKVFYSHAYYTEEDFFGKLYDGEKYHALRKKYGAEQKFKSVYEKVITKGNDLG